MKSIPKFAKILAMAAARVRPMRRRAEWARSSLPHGASGVSVVIPSRNGKQLLAAQLPGIVQEAPSEIMVVDNGSDDGTAEWLRSTWPGVRPIVSAGPLSFARAVNRGIAESRYSHVCLLNNDMQIEPGFFRALSAAFERVPDLFCATAQIRFPEGVRREETGKAVMAQSNPEDFPIRCDEPLPGEDGTWVLYGSGGCSLYDVRKLRALGNVDEVYEPAYVEDLDLGYRAWLRGWPSVYVAGAVVEHRHRSTTSRYYSEEQLQQVLEINYLKFLARAIVDRGLFLRLWKQQIQRRPNPEAWRIALKGGEQVDPVFDEAQILALTDGSVAVFPGGGNEPVTVIATKELGTPSTDLVSRHCEIVLVRGNENSPAYRLAKELALRKHCFRAQT